MPRYFSKKITVDELAENIWGAWKKHNNFKDCSEGYKGFFNEKGEIIDSKLLHFSGDFIRYGFKDLTPQIKKDLKKIKFDCENTTTEPTDAYGSSVNGDIKDYVGLHTLDNGLSFLGVTAGGDWECPLFFMIYSDGSKLRAYIPKEGNVWNISTKEAYGNKVKADTEELKKRGFVKVYEDDEDFEDDFPIEPGDYVKFDLTKLDKDIKKRIQFKGK